MNHELSWWKQWLQLRVHIGFWMRLVSNHVSYAFARKLEASGVTVAEWVVLREMYGGDDTTWPSAVAELTGLTRGAVSKLISRLLAKGLVTRKESTSDRRYQDIELTRPPLLWSRLAKLADKNIVFAIQSALPNTAGEIKTLPCISHEPVSTTR